MTNYVVKKQGGRMNEEARVSLLANIRGLFQDKTFGDYSERELSNKFGYARATIRKYIDEIRGEIDPKDIQHTKLKFKSLFEEAIIICEKFVKKAVKEDRERDAKDSIRLMLLTIKEETDFMERFFIKEKVSDKIEITSVNINIDLELESNKILEAIQ